MQPGLTLKYAPKDGNQPTACTVSRRICQKELDNFRKWRENLQGRTGIMTKTLGQRLRPHPKTGVQLTVGQLKYKISY
jgi:hypothetical protein